MQKDELKKKETNLLGLNTKKAAIFLAERVYGCLLCVCEIIKLACH